jgi:putative DNA primase/helicase
MSDLAGVLDQFAERGMPRISEAELELDAGRWIRYGPGKKAYYQISRRISRAGNEYYTGAFGYKGDGPHQIRYQGPQLTADERAALEQRLEQLAKRNAAKRAREIQAAANDAANTWRTASSSGQSPYLERKGLALLSGPWIRFSAGNVIVPMCRYDLPDLERMRGIQIIRPDGEKRFTYGMEKIGAAAVLGMHQVRRPILIAEGLATAGSIWLALARQYRVFVAFDCGNLAPVGAMVRTVHPDAQILFCADDDYQTEGNPGRTKATAAARELERAGVAFPHFRNRNGARLTDFNDLHVTEGLEAVAGQLESTIKWLPKL